MRLTNMSTCFLWVSLIFSTRHCFSNRIINVQHVLNLLLLRYILWLFQLLTIPMESQMDHYIDLVHIHTRYHIYQDIFCVLYPSTSAPIMTQADHVRASQGHGSLHQGKTVRAHTPSHPTGMAPQAERSAGGKKRSGLNGAPKGITIIIT